MKKSSHLLQARTRIGIVGPSSRVPRTELALGLDALRKRGFSPRIHSQVKKHHLFFSGTDQERAQGFFDFACDPTFSILWCARGGYGSARLLPLLEKMTAERGVPEKKLLVGFSDAIALIEFTRKKWGWSTLHAPMPGVRKFLMQTEGEWTSLISFVHGKRPASAPWAKQKLEYISKRPRSEIKGTLVGGNLAVWSSLLGTPYAPTVRGKILFFEDVDESLYRIDRMFQQVVQSGGLNGVKAVILGNFLGCEDQVSSVLSRDPEELTPAELSRVLREPRPEDTKLLRPRMEKWKAMREIFGGPCEALGIPLAFRLPAGHGPEVSALPLGAEYGLSPQGKLRLIRWDWEGALDN